MKDDPAKDDLLNEVLQETTPQAFRSGLLNDMLRQVRHQQRRRQRTQRLLAGACALLGLVLVARLLPGRKQPTAGASDPLVVHSQPLGPTLIVTTQPGVIGFVQEATNAVAFVQTLPAVALFETIGDDKLLALLAGRPAALVRLGPSEEELVFVNPDDRDGFVVP